MGGRTGLGSVAELFEPGKYIAIDFATESWLSIASKSPFNNTAKEIIAQHSSQIDHRPRTAIISVSSCRSLDSAEVAEEGRLLFLLCLWRDCR